MIRDNSFQHRVLRHWSGKLQDKSEQLMNVNPDRARLFVSLAHAVILLQSSIIDATAEEEVEDQERQEEAT